MLSDKAITELERERDDWKNIFDAYCRDEQEGLELFAGKDGRCGLCPKYKKIHTYGGREFLTCRECPIVVLSRRTCYNMWLKEGYYFPDDEKKKPYEGMRVAKMTYEFLNKLIREARNGS